jgi:hypothetical protein
MAERQTWHVTTHDGDGWQVKKAGNERATSTHESKQEAVEAGREIAKKQAKGQLKIHKTDGTIQEERTYGDDPPGTKG